MRMFGRSRWIVWGLALGFALGALGAPAASASHTQEALFQDSNRLLIDPVGTLAKLRLLGVDRVRMFMHWNYVAPQPNSHQPPGTSRSILITRCLNLLAAVRSMPETRWQCLNFPGTGQQ